MKCEIVRDLFPSYIDGLTSDESNREIEKHLEGCTECCAYLDAMKKEMVSDMYLVKSEEEIKAEIRPFKKLKEAGTEIALITAIGCILLFCLYTAYFEQSTRVNFDDVEITYEKIGEVVDVRFTPKKEGAFVLASEEVIGSDWESGNDYIQIVKYHVNPFKIPSYRSDYFRYIFVDENTLVDQYDSRTVSLTGDEKLTIEFADTDKQVKIKDLYTGKGIEELYEDNK